MCQNHRETRRAIIIALEALYDQAFPQVVMFVMIIGWTIKNCEKLSSYSNLNKNYSK